MNTDLTQEQLKDLLNYDPETGIFTRKKLIRGKGVLDEVVGSRHRDGHLRITISGKPYFLHRLAWLWVYGVWPVFHIDHINGIPDDNRIVNLRDVDVRTNAENQKQAQKSSKTKLLGVCWHEQKKLFMASIRINGKVTFIGYYKTAEEGHQAYLNKKREAHKGCTI